MSQDSGVIPNETGAPVRAKINLAFAALMSNNSGPTAPSPSYACMTWPDTANDILKMRNAANTNWITGPKLSDLANFGTGALTAGAGTFSSSSASPLLSIQNLSSTSQAGILISNYAATGSGSIYYDNVSPNFKVRGDAGINLVLGANGADVVTVSSAGLAVTGAVDANTGAAGAQYKARGWDAIGTSGTELKLGGITAGQWLSVGNYVSGALVTNTTAAGFDVTGALSATGLASFGKIVSTQNAVDSIGELINTNAAGYGLYVKGGGSGNYALSVNDYAGNNIALISPGASAFTGTLSATGDFSLSKTITAPGTTGAQTINKSTGRVNFAAAATSLVVTNSLVTANSIVTGNIATADATAADWKIVAASGSFTITLGTAPTAETAFDFRVTN